MELDLSTAYTVEPLEDKTHQQILHKWVNSNQHQHKASLCRFFLRGICIMKKEYCKFAHGMDDLIEYQEEVPPPEMNEKERKKRQTNKKSFFNQKALFLCDLRYYNLYEFSKETNPKNPLSPQALKSDDDTRNKLRIKFHRNQWQKFIDHLEKRYPQANITIPFLSSKYYKYGFCKPHTHCKLHMILFWIEQSNFYVRHEVCLPPILNSKVSIIFKRYSKRPIDKLLLADYQSEQKEQKGQKPAEIDRNKLNQDLIKQYINGKYVNEKTSICKFYMKGLCMFTEEECKYCHSFDTIKYIQREDKIKDLQYFEQKALFAEPKLNYLSLFRYQQILSQTNANHQYHSLEQVNKNSNLRQQLRSVLHMDLYKQFLGMLENIFPNSNWTLSFLRREYTNCGLNKTKVDKFPSFVDQLDELGYQVESFIVPPYRIIKKQFVFKRPPLEKISQQISYIFVEIIQKRLENAEEDEEVIITEPYIRKKYYEFQNHFAVPLHRYLKLRNIILKDYIQQQIDTNHSLQPFLSRVAFDLKDNIEKIKQTLKQYYNNTKKHQHQYCQIERYLKENCSESIKNYITASGLKYCIIGESLELYKQIYIFPNNEIVICSKKHNQEGKSQCPCKIQKITVLKVEENFANQNIQKYKNQRMIIVDSEETLFYAQKVLPTVNIVGVDLEGNLKEDGFIYLVQFGIKNPFTSHNQTIVFDIWKMKENPPLLKSAQEVIKFVLQNDQITKVMHDCKNDSIALHSLLNSCLYPVFDTCAMQVYFDQKELNTKYKEKQQFIRDLFKIFNKTMGLNQILQKYGRPINQLKDYMRKMFQADHQTKQEYFEKRPIEKDFLQYAVRDVEELVDTFHQSIKHDQHKIWKQIGLCASTLNLK